MNIDEIKAFLRIDGNEEDVFLLSLQISAETYFTGADIVKNYSNELYKLAVKFLIAHWYENRSIIGDSKQIPFSLTCMVTQLQYGGDPL